ncbi:hypothetical protein ACR78F_17405 [Sphingobacterium spiritivorum]|uniref:hypothetical protein n=1 Tax=Sphingobacterium spiritivorum TaxID=258 RepID=UPI0036C6F26C
MKRKIQKIRAGVIALLLCSGTAVWGQSISNPPLNVGPSTSVTDAGRVTAITPVLTNGTSAYETVNSILFYNPATNGPSLTLVAALNEDVSVLPTPRTALRFTNYTWYYMGTSGTAAASGAAFNTNLVAGGYSVAQDATTANNKLPLTNLTEGYHYFKVQGVVNPDNAPVGALCTPQEEVFVVYVLPRLNIASAGVLAGGATDFAFCESESSGSNTQAKVQVTATPSFVTSGLTPAVSDFTINYRWYAVKVDAANAPLAGASIDDAKFDPSTLTGVTALTGTANSIFPQISAFGKYKILVEAEYAIKDRSNGLSADDPANRNRPYVIYRDFAVNGASDLIITVTPTPGKPHITIEAVTD